MKRLNVFLRSAMTGELDQERAALRILFHSDPTLASLVELYAIEDHAGPTSIERAYVDEVTYSDVLILLLNKELRPAVEKEYLTASRVASDRSSLSVPDRTASRAAGLDALFTMIPPSSSSWLCSRLDETERKSLEQLLQSRRFRAGESVFRAGDPAQCMYFVKSGHLHILLDIHGGERLVVAKIGSGEMLGELSFSTASRAFLRPRWWRMRNCWNAPIQRCLSFSPDIPMRRGTC